MAVDRPGHERRFRRGLTLAAGVRQPAALFVATASAAGGKAVRLWGGQGRRNQARELLAPVYGWFSEGSHARSEHLQPLAQCHHTGLRFSVIRNSHQYDNPPHPLGLRTRRKRPRGRAAEQRDELAALHDTTVDAERPRLVTALSAQPSRCTELQQAQL